LCPIGSGLFLLFSLMAVEDCQASPGMMKIYPQLDAHRLDFLHRFYSANMVSPLTLRFRWDRRQVSGFRCQNGELLNPET
jgi:hypothetical protein